MTAIVFAKPQLMTWNSIKITDHNRSELEIATERIGNQKRMANATKRGYWIADKRKFSVSWTDLPGSTDYTVDGFAGADDIAAFYLANKGVFSLTLIYADGQPNDVVSVMFTPDFSKRLKKRGITSIYDVEVSMEEV